MERLTVGVVAGDWAPELALGTAAARRLDVTVCAVAPEDAPSRTVAGLIVDAPAGARAGALRALAGRWQVPILVATPFAGTLEEATALYRQVGGAPVFSANPLRFSLPTRRLLEEVRRSGDPVESLFAAWRFQPGRGWEDATPRLLDFVGALCGSEPVRISAMRHERPEVVLAMLRFGNGVVGSLEIGAHLPGDFATETELVLECICRESVYHCAPENQAITIQGSTCRRHGWLPDPAEGMVAAFVETLRGAAPGRGAPEDLLIVAQCEEIRNSAAEGIAHGM